MQQSPVFAYDRVLYPSYLHEQTHPDRLAVIGSFFGMTPKPAENCRVLELGCGTGASLLSFALDLKESEFYGVDLSQREIEIGNEIKDFVGLSNLQLIHGDVMKIGPDELGVFDYIVAHGLYSWVPDPVRARILDICREMLAPQGIAFISYNAYPGAHLRQMVREMMLFHTSGIDDPEKKVVQARALVKFMLEAVPAEKPHKATYDAELNATLEKYSESIFHDDLADINRAFYFSEFAADAAAHGLKYLSDVQYLTGKNLNYAPNVVKTLQDLGDDVARREQYLDFLDCRRFRQSLLVHANLELTSTPKVDVLERVYIGSDIQAENDEPKLTSKQHEVFHGPNEQRIEIDHPLSKALLYHLIRIRPQPIKLDELVQKAREALNEEHGGEFEVSDEDVEAVKDLMMRIFGHGLLELQVHLPFFAPTVSDHPTASPLVRWQAAHGSSLSSLRHETLHMDDALMLKLLQLLDGTRDIEQLHAEMVKFVEGPDLKITPEQREDISGKLRDRIPLALESLAGRALLIS